ncbi:peptidase G2 autoproteolytic cleavage domain-containing protein [Cohnella hashimotonis]|uniref:Peptidase G2 autoproteolytic cleavage domain-containing protein n=1 Tax=Cohnella hashimotonis TaxID=2826895 RepID=A0ABT6TKN0_9BACL|nr:peptidase G2 autoproteolytic cleavage domain-containing protein [Cohnella hashimotonis]MDI4647404.1 peptidase G2 autoproteolytic cleavage domain-containing protein [Cohnella hashimotonis]
MATAKIKMNTGTPSQPIWEEVDLGGGKGEGIDSHKEGNDTHSWGFASHAEGNATVAGIGGSTAEILQYLDGGSNFGLSVSNAGFVVNSGETLTYSYWGFISPDDLLGRKMVGSGIIDSFQATGGVLSIWLNTWPTAYSFDTDKSLQNKYNASIGTYSSHAEGSMTQALGNTSHSEGWFTVASGDNSHSEGKRTEALSKDSHTEGQFTRVNVTGTDIEGNNLYRNVDLDIFSYDEMLPWAGHAEGYDTLVTGAAGHAEGIHTLASNIAAHAEGISSEASGWGAHAEGNTTISSGDGAHAEGNRTIASGGYSHSEGDFTVASGYNSHAEGEYTTASGNNSHAEGKGATASGGNAHAEGYQTKASGESSHAEGRQTSAVTNFSHAEGQYTSALSSEVSLSITSFDATNKKITLDTSFFNTSTSLLNTLVAGDVLYIKVDGGVDLKVTLVSRTTNVLAIDTTPQETWRFASKISGTNVPPYPVHAEGYSTMASGPGSHAEGYYTGATDFGSHSEGFYTKSMGQGSHSEGSNTIASGLSSHSEGQSTKASGPNSHAEGFTTQATGAVSHAEGNSTIASGEASHAEGAYTTASGSSSHAEGTSTKASGTNSHAEGRASAAVQQYSHAEGDGTVAGASIAPIYAFNKTAKTISTTFASSFNLGDIIYIYSYVSSSQTPNIVSASVVSKSGDVITLSGDPTGGASVTVVSFATKYAVYNANSTGSHAEGVGTTAWANGSHAEGLYTRSTDYGSHSEGILTVASSMGAHAEGHGTKVSPSFTNLTPTINTDLLGTSSITTVVGHAEGYDTLVTGAGGHAEGISTTASGIGSHAEGGSTIASGTYSHSEGLNTTASNYASHVMGRYNKLLTGSATAYSSSSDAFVIGNGTSTSALGNAFRVTFAGATYGLSAFNSTGADYGEFFEWLDGNPNGDDRTGLFVTLDGDKIRLASSSDDFILGIVSANPSVIGDSHDDWQGKYLRDEWGRIQYHEVAVPAMTLDENGVDIQDGEHFELNPIYNPEWDSSLEYVGRENRKEWAVIGMMGKLRVRDDGTCVVNGLCKPNDQGIASSSTSGYKVMKRVTNNIVMILIK